jgi:hypothetical protein
MTNAEMRAALNLGPEWQVIWTGANPLDSHQHLCGGLYGPGGTIPTGARPLVTGRR